MNLNTVQRREKRDMKNKWGNGITAAVKSVFTVWAFMFDTIYDTGRSLLGQISVQMKYGEAVWCMAAISVGLLYMREQKDKESHWMEAAFAGIFSLFMLLGKSFSLYNHWKMLNQSNVQIILAICAGLGWWFLFYMLLKQCVRFCENRSVFSGEIIGSGVWKNYFGIILLGWLPFLVMCYPGNVTTDAIRQLSMWCGYRPATNHHPWFTTLLFGQFMNIGRYISDNTGIFIIVVFQVVLCGAIYSHLCLRVRRYVGKNGALLTALFFAVVPMWGSYSVSVVKDTMFYAVFALYFCFFIDIFTLNDEMVSKKEERKRWLLFFVMNGAVCLIRNDGIYRVIPAGIALLAAVLKRKKMVFAVLVSVYGVLLIYNTFIFDVLGIAKGDLREMLSIPLQQTARYVRDCNDVSEEEKDIIQNFMAMSLDELKEGYNEELSDPVKGKTKVQSMEELLRYGNVWLHMGLRHPGIYLQATINNTYGYYYPFHNPEHRRGYQYYIKEDPNFDIKYNNKKSVNLISGYAHTWRVFPGISLLSSPGTYTWLTMIGIMILLKKRRYRELSVTSVFVLHILVCIASPVNGDLRYAMPLIACMPVYIAWVMTRNVLRK